MQDNNAKTFSIAALVLGILGIVGGFLTYIPFIGSILSWFTFIFAILGIVFGVLARKRCAAVGMPTSMATAGMVLGIIGVVLGVIGCICVMACAGMFIAAAGSI